MHPLQLVRRGVHGRGRCLHVLVEIGELLVRRGDVAALHAHGEGHHLVAQLLLCIGEELALRRCVLGRRSLLVLLLPGCGDQLFFALGYIGLVVALSATATAAASTAALLRLGELALKGIDLDEADVGARLAVTVLRGGVDAHQIAGHQLEIFQRQHVRTIGILLARCLQQVHIVVRPAVDRIVKVHIFEAKLIGGLHADCDFFDGARTVVARGPVDRDLRRLRLVGGDEVVLREAHRLAFIGGGDVIRAVLLHVDRALVLVAVAARQMDGLAVIEREHPVLQGPVHLHLERRVSPFDRAQIARVLLNLRLHSGPLRIVVGHLHLLHGRQIHHAHFVVRRDQRPRGHVVLDILRQAGEDELVGRSIACVRRGLHGHWLPSVRALVMRKQPRLVGLHSAHARGNQLIAVAPHGHVARRYGDGI